MNTTVYYVGIDIAAATFAASVYQSPEQSVKTKENFENTTDGFNKLRAWMKQENLTTANSLICMEATGVYSEALAYYLAAAGFTVAVEPPLKVKRAFHPHGHKTDAVDSRQIAEYAYRFRDELRLWEPKEEIVEKIKQLLAAREQFIHQRTAVKNELHAYSRHVVKVEVITRSLEESIQQLECHIENIEKELNENIRKDKTIFKNVKTLNSITGFGMLLAANIITATNNFSTMPDYKTLAAFTGIAPYQNKSGASIHKKDRSRQFGPPRLRKLLRLAAQSAATHDTTFKKYYLRKLEEGKAKALVLNNIANKLLKLAFAMVKNDTYYIKNYKSVNPMYV